MNTIHAFGDSYIAEDSALPNPGWSTMLAKNINMKLINYGTSGSSTPYSIKKFVENKTTFINGDIVLFVFTFTGRIHLEFQNEYPRTAGKFLRLATDKKFYDTFIKIGLPGAVTTWYNENKHHFHWYFRNRDLELEKINDLAYRSLLLTTAQANPGVKFIIMYVDKSAHWIHTETDYQIKCENFVEVPLSLFAISNNELGKHLPTEFIKKIKIDPRKNHMSVHNLKIFSDLIQKTIETSRVDHITPDAFLQNIFRPILNISDYEYYIQTEHLYNMEKMRNYLNDQ